MPTNFKKFPTPETVANLAQVPAKFQQALALHQNGQLAYAQTIYEEILKIQPEHFDSLHLLGVIAWQTKNPRKAIKLIDRAIEINPDYPATYGNRGLVLHELKMFDSALASYDKAISLDANYADAHYNRGNVLRELEQFAAALASYDKAIAIKADYADAYYNRGNALQTRGKLNEAMESYRKALLVRTDYAEAYSNLLFLHAYHGTLEPAAYLSLARGYEQASVPVHDGDSARNRTFHRLPLAGRRLRIAYVSGDFRQHAVSNFIEQLFSRHDRARVELFAYSTSAARDAVTGRLQAMVEHWTAVAGMSDSAFLQRIEADSIDVLIDLSGHTAHNRMTVFARRAAPVQAHYLGFMASTGLTEMDYWIGDDVLIPPEADKHFTEQVWRLPRVWVAYRTMDDAPEPDWQPAANGSVWVGSFNNLGKLTPETFALWAKVLHALPQGRLLLKTRELADAGNCRRVMDTLGRYGIAADRIELQTTDITPGWKEHMAYYNRLDIALDPVGGIGGGTTTCDALWMGVPVITLAGDRMATRMTASMLGAIGHNDWIACSESDYVDKVVELARDAQQRQTLRSCLREKIAGSPLCDAQDLTVTLEDAYFEMYERWLQK